MLAALAVGVFTLAACSSALAEVTGAADNLRTGWYPDEPSLAPAQITQERFKQVFKRRLRGQVYAQPLTANGTLLVVTEENWAYGLDPITGPVRWEKQFGTAVEAGPEGSKKTIECEDLEPRVGITGTPVVDTEHNIAYFVSNQYISGSAGPIAWYMHAVELASGNEVANFPVEIKGEAQNLPPPVPFEATQQLQRPALLMLNGVIYAGFGSHCDHLPYSGWVVGVSTLGQLTTMWAASPKNGGAIWQSGGGLISDGPGQILFTTGNSAGKAGGTAPLQGPGNKPPEGRLSDSVVRLEVEGLNLKAKDFFSPVENVLLDTNDFDLGSAAPIALPSEYFGTPSVPHLLVQAGKEGYVYLLNRDNLGGMGQGPGGKSDQVVQRIGPYGGVWDGTAVWPGDGGYVYIPAVAVCVSLCGTSDHLRFFKYGLEKGSPTLSLAATSPDLFGFGSGSPIVTSNAATSGTAVMWTTRCPDPTCKEATLRAYSPVPSGKEPGLLWQASIGTANKFSRPDASNGHIYVGNREGDVFGYGGPSLTPSTPSLSLGQAPVNGQLAGQVTFTNTGTKLKVSAVHLPSAPFEASGLPEVGSVIEPGQAITVGVAFRSPAPGGFTGSLGLTTEAGETSVALSASAAQPPPPSGTLTTASLSTGTGGRAPSSSGTLAAHAAKPLTQAQKLTKAIAACQKLKKSTRARCMATAKKRYSPSKHKAHKNTKARKG